MKKLLSLIIVFCGLAANAQNYLISFIGTGASTTVSTVKVDNLTKATTLSITGSDILHLTVATAVNPVKDNQSSQIKIYPNPMTDNSTLEIFPPVAGNAVITVLDMTGKQVAQTQSYLEHLKQSFRLSGIKKGFYLINVKGNNYKLSERLLSNSRSNGTISIEKVNNIIQAIDKKAEKAGSKGTQATIDMEYTTGDRLKFTGTSGNYSTIKIDIPASTKTITFNFTACTDGDNNNYPVVEIGSAQVWMAENLKTTKLNENTTIINITGNSAWTIQTNPAYCWFNNNAATYKTLYGAIYNWYAVNTLKLCPTGWHVPTDQEFGILETNLGMAPADISLLGWRGTDQGTQLKNSTGWDTGQNGTNASGFSALPGGYRYYLDGTFQALSSFSYWWTSSIASSTEAWYRRMDGSEAGVLRGSTDYKAGKYVRCLKN